MNIFHHLHLTRKQKKKALMRKNEMHQGIFNLLRMRRGEADRIKNLKDVGEKDRKKRRNREEENREDKKRKK